MNEKLLKAENERAGGTSIANDNKNLKISREEAAEVLLSKRCDFFVDGVEEGDVIIFTGEDDLED